MEHYYSENPTSVLREKEVKLKLRGNELDLVTVSGVFSFGSVDSATILLIENSEIPNSGDVLDLGCGYGSVGCALGKSFPDLRIVMSDVNLRALDYAKRNIKKNRLLNCRVVRSDCFSNIPESFNTILLNPPINAGRKLCVQMIIKSKEHLKPSGTLQIVARHNKGGRYYSAVMKEVFGEYKEDSIY